MKPLPQPIDFTYSLDQSAIKWAFKTYWNRKFLKLAKINSLEQIEKDRIFNELIIAGEILIMLTLEAKDLKCDDGRKEMLLKCKDLVASTHDNFMKKLGIERKYRKLWKKLISMRYEEYAKDKFKAREAMMEYESKGKELEISDLEGISLTVIPFTVAVGVHRHIIRRKTKGKDLLFKLIMKRLSR